jgi:uncharacterized protein
MSKHPIVHIEFAANDPQAAGGFYSQLFDWKLDYDPNLGYMQFQPESGPGGGFNKVGATEAAGFETKAGDVLVYVATDDIDATLARAESLGGKTLVPKMEIPGIGWFSIFTDPTGNKVGLYTSLQQMS